MGGPVRPGSTADRARLTRAPQPEPALKCPRCDSTNTKFCYYNNYSLSQPRHFCKTCRRYWTRGGALRSVPVGGGCRRNKRSKSSSSSSKSPAATTMASSSAAASTVFASGAIQPSIPPSPQLPFMASMHHTVGYAAPNFDLNFAGIQPMDAVNYQVGGSSSSGLEQWRLQQFQHFPLFGGLEPPAPETAYPFDREGGGVDGAGFAGQFHATASSSGLAKQMASVKMEDNPQGRLNLARQFMGFPRNTQYWGGGGGGGGGGSDSGGGGWMADLSGFNPSSSGNPL